MIQHMDTSPTKSGDTTKLHDPENEMVDIWCLKKQLWMIYPPSNHTKNGRFCQETCRHSWEAQVGLWPIRGTYCILPHRFSSWHQANSQAVQKPFTACPLRRVDAGSTLRCTDALPNVSPQIACPPTVQRPIRPTSVAEALPVLHRNTNGFVNSVCPQNSFWNLLKYIWIGKTVDKLLDFDVHYFLDQTHTR